MTKINTLNKYLWLKIIACKPFFCINQYYYKNQNIFSLLHTPLQNRCRPWHQRMNNITIFFFFYKLLYFNYKEDIKITQPSSEANSLIKRPRTYEKALRCFNNSPRVYGMYVYERIWLISSSNKCKGMYACCVLHSAWRKVQECEYVV